MIDPSQIAIVIAAALSDRDNVIHLIGDPRDRSWRLAGLALAEIAVALQNASSFPPPRSSTTAVAVIGLDRDELGMLQPRPDVFQPRPD